MKRIASALLLVSAVTLLPDRVSAEAIGGPAEEGWSPEGYLLSLGIGAYRPKPGSEDFDLVYPSDNGPILLVEFDFYLYRIPFIGPIGLGIAGGWAAYKGAACETANLPACVPSTQTAKFNLFPLNLMAVVRIDALARKTPVPFVFTGKVGFNSVFFNEDVGSGKSSGRSHGFGWAAQFAIELNFVNERRANALDEDWGINSSFFFFELAGSDANSRAPVGDNLYFTGGLGLTF
ncbi:MAG: MXAN_2562 family outer membrane beta-barrel protein [Myxococcales bacterium]|nr:MXAN_2562 family outer membrane beta-barrel protein [Myxococcales bacterium]MDH3484212.1 MXAN_2562 family outer membrane beta-barrel protein [Myxococcales bacterium]